MDTETIAFIICVAAATAIAGLLYERRMDVLHGPFIEGRARRQTPAQQLLALAHPVFERFRWKARNVIYLTSIIAC